MEGVSQPVAEDRRGRLVTAGTGGFVRRPGRGAGGSAWQVFDRSHGMPPGGRFLALLVDRDGGMWLSRAGTGLWRWLGYERWEHWSKADGLPHDVVWSVARDRAGTLQVATSAGAAHFDEGSRRFAATPGTAGARFTALHADARGQVWAAADDGRLLRRGAPPATAFVTAGAGSSSRYGLWTRPDGSLWFAGDDGIGWWPDAVYRPLPLGAATAAGARTQALELCESPSGTLWAASSLGVQRITGARLPAELADKQLHGYFPSIACGRDGTVFATNDQGRIYRITDGDARPQVTDITPPLLAGRVVLALAHDRRGWLWANTDAGVAVWNGRLWRLLDQSQGLIWNDTSSGGLYEDRDGTMWISTSQGLSHMIDPASIFAPVLPPSRISATLHAGRPLAPGTRLQLPWTRSSALEVVLEAPSYRDRATQAFEHRLVGFDDAWRRTGGSVIRYAGLPAGSYRLQARLVDEQLGATNAPVELDLDIDAPWWETWAFRFAVGALAAVAVIGGHRWRMRQARQRERELAALVAERTRELEASREELRERATKDSLTGAWNRGAVLEMLTHDAERCARDQQPLTVVLADIDHFKRINDELGHPAGDEVLRQFVSRLRAVVRPYDAIGRYGGEEFVLLLRGLCTDKPEDRARIGAIHAAIAATPMQLADGVERLVTCSFGAACARPGAAASQADLIQHADEALYRAKRAGRDRVEYVDLDACCVEK
jgi:diguanylate cyclase (GGDEF)-like protein